MGAVARHITGEQRAACDRGVGPDERIRRHAVLSAPSPPVVDEGLASEKRRLTWNGFHGQRRLRNVVLELLDAREGHRQLCGDDGIDRERIAQGRRFEPLLW